MEAYRHFRAWASPGLRISPTMRSTCAALAPQAPLVPIRFSCSLKGASIFSIISFVNMIGNLLSHLCWIFGLVLSRLHRPLRLGPSTRRLLGFSHLYQLGHFGPATKRLLVFSHLH